MNDSTTAQLTSDWTIPTYAQSMLSVTSDAGDASTIEGEKGLFELSAPAQLITIRWGGESGAPLTQVRWQADTLEWDGSVRLGGFVTSMHVTQPASLDFALAIATVEAYPLKPKTLSYLSPRQRKQTPYAAPDFLDGVDDDSDEGVTTWIAEYDSPLTGLLQDALNQDNRIYLFGHLADEVEGWHELFALPIVLDSVTVFMK